MYNDVFALNDDELGEANVVTLSPMPLTLGMLYLESLQSEAAILIT